MTVSKFLSFGFFTLHTLQTVLVTLKLSGSLSWSWWQVLFPFTAPAVIAGVFALWVISVAVYSGK